MSEKLSIVLFLGAFGFLVFIFSMIRSKSLDYKYAFTWIITSIAFIFVSLFPQTVYAISGLLGIETPVNALFSLLFLFLMNIIFSLSIAISQGQDRIKTLTQEIGLMKLEISQKKMDYTRIT
ncbi:MAG: DUF2304 domain-containing protein [Youngiibacter sp.]|nr:DUF2304 domain-containing protein [Youngiibacter sp.]